MKIKVGKEKGQSKKLNQDEKSGKRILWLDILRIISILAVVMIHASTQNLEDVVAGSAQNIVFATFDGLSRFAVPVFVMISGALMLKRDLSYKKCLKKILRLLIVWGFWCVFYAGFSLAAGKGKEAALHDLIFGHFHMWFLPMIAGLYLITPILRWIAKNQGWCVVAIIILVVLSVGLQFRWTSYPMYYLMGYVLGDGNWASGRKRVLATGMMAGLFLATAVVITGLNAKASVEMGAVVHPLDADWSILAIVQSVAVFALIKLLFAGRAEKKTEQKICSRLAGDVLGVYLVHVAVLGALNRMGVSNVMFENANNGGLETLGAISGILVTMILTTVVSVLIIEVMRKIPMLRKTV